MKGYLFFPPSTSDLALTQGHAKVMFWKSVSPPKGKSEVTRTTPIAAG